MAQTDILTQLKDMRERGELDAEEYELARKYAKEQKAKSDAKVAYWQARFANARPWYKRPWLVLLLAFFAFAAVRGMLGY